MASPRAGSFSLTLPADARSVPLARTFAAALAGTLAVDETTRDTMELAFSEGAIWAATDHRSFISLRVTASPGLVVVEVEPVATGAAPDGVDSLDVLSAVTDTLTLEASVLRFEIALR